MKTRKIAYLGMLMALALVLSYVESLIPFAVGIPGVKLGLTNIVTVIMLYIAAPMEHFCYVYFVRCFQDLCLEMRSASYIHWQAVY